MVHRLVFGIVIILLGSCMAHRKATTLPVDKILIAVFEASNVSKTTIDVKLTDYHWADGQLHEAQRHAIPKTNAWTFKFLDEKKHLITSAFVVNPLSHDVEYSTDNNRLERQVISLDKSSFIVRAQVPTNTKFISVFDAQHVSLGTFNLSFP